MVYPLTAGPSFTQIGQVLFAFVLAQQFVLSPYTTNTQLYKLKDVNEERKNFNKKRR